MSITVANPQLSPSLNEYGEAVLTDPHGNQIPIVALVHPSVVDGSNELGTLTVIPGIVSQVTGRQGKPQISVPGVGTLPILAVMNITASGAGAKSGAKFQSAPQTGTGSSQSIAHGLGVVPSLVLAAPYDNTASGSTPFTFQIVEGSHDATNIKITATSGLIYKVIAFA